MLIVFYFTEAYSKYYHLSFEERPLIAKTVKATLFFFILYKIRSQNKVLIQLLIICTIFFIGQLCIEPNFEVSVFVMLIKYLFPLLLFAYVNIQTLQGKARKWLCEVFEYIVVFNSILVILGYIFGIVFFKTYIGNRFGYNGLFVSSATGSYAYLISLIYFMIKYEKRFIYNRKVVLVIITSFIIGTKVVYMGLILILLYYVLFQTDKKYKIPGICILLIVSISGVHYLFLYSDFIGDLYSKRGFLTSFLSYRDIILKEKMIPFIKEEWSIWNYFFGGINEVNTRPQMGFIDLFYFMGLIGGVWYLYVYSYNFFTFKRSAIMVLFVVTLGTAIFFSGNFFLNASTAIYLVVVREMFLAKDCQDSLCD